MTFISLSDLSRSRGGSQPLRGYLAKPAGDGPWPGVVMVHEAFGLTDLDRGLKDAAAKLDAALTKAGVEHDVKEYPTAGHAFLNDAETGPRLLRPIMRAAHMGPDPAAAADAWERIETFFDAQLRR
jgi:dienelactone hydrolase